MDISHGIRVFTGVFTGTDPEKPRRVRPKRLAFGHLWELGHRNGRLTAPRLRNAFAAARRVGADPVLALWGDRLS